MAHGFRIVSTGRKPPWLRFALLLLGVAAVGFGAWGAYAYGRHSTLHVADAAHATGQRLELDNRQLMKRLSAAQAANTELSGTVAYLKRSHEIDGGACQLVKRSLSDLQQENSGLREQLAFYRGVVSPKQSASGLHIYDFKIARDASATRLYDYELLLMQSLHHTQLARGRTEIEIDGLEAAKHRLYRLPELTAASPPTLSFSFKYFQELDGRLRLPKGFRPLRVTVRLLPSDGQPQVVQAYDWAKVERKSVDS